MWWEHAGHGQCRWENLELGTESSCAAGLVLVEKAFHQSRLTVLVQTRPQAHRHLRAECIQVVAVGAPAQRRHAKIIKDRGQQHAAALPSTATELNLDTAQHATTNSDTNPASDSELDSDWEEESDEGGDEPLRPMWDELDSHDDVLAQNDAPFVESEHFDVENMCAGDSVVEGDGVDLTQPALLDILSDSPVTLDSCGITSQEKVTKSTKGKGFDLTNISFTM
ncbi:hypothetical protein EW146_g2736 [Bondarzewia mesenterica]|uniref:Uncharacterized protein n=1 Tax=Bondarzewia mesenterica TaxID=1095465 RepID=A0A4S4M190_9AGAM|nr:hypothetical protein EW146_g2736 [Bondarzewia mesenterica]